MISTREACVAVSSDIIFLEIPLNVLGIFFNVCSKKNPSKMTTSKRLGTSSQLPLKFQPLLISEFYVLYHLHDSSRTLLAAVPSPVNVLCCSKSPGIVHIYPRLSMSYAVQNRLAL
ncbi:unnamed protein product [Spodoptera littoralis]|uniref:Uncharacterized protein n=1 Tax=Spodoptera littoralis TaxID=7109 RepID=A0A9P0IHH6_SPOLI|nr:unnamed protein product [Spodoptera littoralis]CAH1647672.1 unnamed protein product [Spodoptera littoralis]